MPTLAKTTELMLNSTLATKQIPAYTMAQQPSFRCKNPDEILPSLRALPLQASLCCLHALITGHKCSKLVFQVRDSYSQQVNLL